MAAKKFQYKNALNEIEQIVNKIENEEIDIDELSELVNRAAELIKMCKTKLRTTGQELDEIIDKLEE